MPLRSQFLPIWGEEPWEELDSSARFYDDSFPSVLANCEDQYRYTSLSDSSMEPHSYGSIFPTAASKQTGFSTAFSNNWQREWRDKPVKQWTCEDVMGWILYVIEEQEKLDYEHLKLHHFNMDGMTLCTLTEKDFTERDPTYGSVLYHAFQTHRMTEGNKSAYLRMYDVKPEIKFNEEMYDVKTDIKLNTYLPPFNNIRLGADPMLEEPILANLTELKVPRESLLHSSDTDSEHSDGFSGDKKDDVQEDRGQIKKKRGRPVGNRSKRKPEKKCGRLWEFIRDLLLKPEYCPSLICWENHDEGVFRFVRSDKVAELWGTIKDNPKMTYEKLSRAMRYYYKSKVLQPVLGRRLVYKFGPTAKGWRTSNPNFRQAM